MKNNSIKILIFFVILILFFMFCSGCTSIVTDISPDDSEPILPSNNLYLKTDWITIENDSETTKDCTPALAIFSEGAAYMSFSGDGNSWTEWMPYQSSYEEFNIANGLYGTIFGSGEKYVYIRFKDSEGNLSPIDEITSDFIHYEMQDLHFIKIVPRDVTISIGGNAIFTLHAYDLGGRNEVPVEGSKIIWTKSCDVGKLNPTVGLSTTYTAPLISGIRNISAHYNNLGAGATILIVKED